MNNEEKILSMLDVIARQVTIVTETAATKEELQAFRMSTEEEFQRVRDEMATKEELQTFRMATEEEFQRVRDEMATKEELQTFRMATEEEFQRVRDEMATKEELQDIKDTMVTKDDFMEQVNDRFDRFEAENNRAHEAILAKIDKQSESFDAKFDVLNDRLFSQEAELRVLQKREAL